MKIKEFFAKNFKNRKFLSPFICVCVFIFVMLVDQLTKAFIISKLIPKTYDHVKVIPKFISFIYVKNNGAAWGIFENSKVFLIIMSFLGIAIISTFYILRVIKASDKSSCLLAVSVGMLLGGAIGNLGDRLVLGYVRDFINFDFMDFPVFNFADTFLTIGIVLLLIYIVFYYAKEVPEGEESINIFKVIKDKINAKKVKNSEKNAKNTEKTVKEGEKTEIIEKTLREEQSENDDKGVTNKEILNNENIADEQDVNENKTADDGQEGQDD